MAPANADIERFLAQLHVLGSAEYDVICFSGQVFAALLEFFEADPITRAHNIYSFSSKVDGITIDVHRVWHYSNWGANAEKVTELEQQLGF